MRRFPSFLSVFSAFRFPLSYHGRRANVHVLLRGHLRLGVAVELRPDVVSKLIVEVAVHCGKWKGRDSQRETGLGSAFLLRTSAEGGRGRGEGMQPLRTLRRKERKRAWSKREGEKGETKEKRATGQKGVRQWCLCARRSSLQKRGVLYKR